MAKIIHHRLVKISLMVKIKSISKWKLCVLWPQNEFLCTFARNESGMVITGQIVEISCSLLNLCLQIS